MVKENNTQNGGNTQKKTFLVETLGGKIVKNQMWMKHIFDLISQEKNHPDFTFCFMISLKKYSKNIQNLNSRRSITKEDHNKNFLAEKQITQISIHLLFARDSESTRKQSTISIFFWIDPIFGLLAFTESRMGYNYIMSWRIV